MLRIRTIEETIAQRYAEHLERLIGPEGSYPPVGRSLTYRTAVFQPLALLAWRKQLPASLPEGQVRAFFDQMGQAAVKAGVVSLTAAATLAMPTSVPCRRARIGAMKGWKVAARPSTLMSNTSRTTARSSARLKSTPTLMPALATTTSGRP